MILNHRQQPWTKAEATHIRHVLHRFSGTRFTLVEHDNGYALRPDYDVSDNQQALRSQPPVRLRPAWRAQTGPLALTAIGGGLVLLSSNAEQLGRNLSGTLAQFALWEPSWLGASLVGASVATLGLMLFVWGSFRLFLNVFSFRYELGTDRLVAQEGIIRRQRRSIDYRHARIPTLRQGVIERLLGIGSVHVSSAGTGDSGEIHLRDIKNPQTILDEIQSRIDAATRGAWR